MRLLKLHPLLAAVISPSIPTAAPISALDPTQNAVETYLRVLRRALALENKKLTADLQGLFDD